MKRRIIICEESEIISEGLSALLDENDNAVVARVTSPDRLSERIIAFDANILIINPIMLGYAKKDLPILLAKEHPNLSIIALVSSYIDNALLKPYHAVIGINDSRQKVSDKLEETANQDEKSDDNVELSRREKDVLVFVAKGLTNKEIADNMNLSIHTVISHRKNITKKTGIKSVSGLTVFALLNGLIDETEIYK